MVETNNAEERLARIEQMLEALQRDSATLRQVAAKLTDVVQTAPILFTPKHQTSRSPARRKH
jgi:alkylhydroperoxidase/carboxymuconolactone decarboxylase family protein YurZ